MWQEEGGFRYAFLSQKLCTIELNVDYRFEGGVRHQSADQSGQEELMSDCWERTAGLELARKCSSACEMLERG